MRLLATFDWPLFVDLWIVRIACLFASAGAAALTLGSLANGTSPDNHPTRP